MWLTLRSGESKKSVEKMLALIGLLGPRPEAEPDVKASSQSTGSKGGRGPVPRPASGDGGISRGSGEKTPHRESWDEDGDDDEEEDGVRKS